MLARQENWIEGVNVLLDKGNIPDNTWSY
jgi:hypothetical protein